MFRSDLLQNYEKIFVKFYVGQFKESPDFKFDEKTDFLQQVQEIEYKTEKYKEHIVNESYK